MNDLNFLANGTRRPLNLIRLVLEVGIVWVQEDADQFSGRNQIAHKPQPFCLHLGDKSGYPGHVATGPVEAAHEAEFDRIATSDEDNWDCGGGCHSREN